MTQLNTTPTRTVRLELPADVEAKLSEKAKDAGLPLEAYLEEVAEREANTGGPSDRLAQEVEWLTTRTPAEVLAARERILAKSPPPRPLPEGKTLFDVVEGTWPGDETDAEIRKALDELS